MDSVGSRLKQLRKQKGLNQVELSEIFNSKYGTSIDDTSISKWENDRRLQSLYHAMAYCNYFKVTLEYILNYIDKVHNWKEE